MDGHDQQRTRIDRRKSRQSGLMRAQRSQVNIIINLDLAIFYALVECDAKLARRMGANDFDKAAIGVIRMHARDATTRMNFSKHDTTGLQMRAEQLHHAVQNFRRLCVAGKTFGESQLK